MPGEWEHPHAKHAVFLRSERNRKGDSTARWGSSVYTPEPPSEWPSSTTVTTRSQALSLWLAASTSLGPQEHSVLFWEALLLYFEAGSGGPKAESHQRRWNSKTSQILFQPFSSSQRFPQRIVLCSSFWGILYLLDLQKGQFLHCTTTLRQVLPFFCLGYCKRVLRGIPASRSSQLLRDSFF